jgi:Leucine-rich repeat (LRR) protein
MSAFTRSALLLHCKAADGRALGSVTTLDLSKQNISQLDIDFAELPLLRVLNLSGNQLSYLPASLKCLVRAVCASIPQCGSRDQKNINVHAFHFIWLVCAGGQTKLTFLNLSQNKFRRLGVELTGLTQLRSLLLNNNELVELPSLSSITELCGLGTI